MINFYEIWETLKTFNKPTLSLKDIKVIFDSFTTTSVDKSICDFLNLSIKRKQCEIFDVNNESITQIKSQQNLSNLRQKDLRIVISDFRLVDTNQNNQFFMRLFNKEDQATKTFQNPQKDDFLSKLKIPKDNLAIGLEDFNNKTQNDDDECKILTMSEDESITEPTEENLEDDDSNVSNFEGTVDGENPVMAITKNPKKKFDEMSQVLIEIYSIILQSGLQGCEYKKILHLLDLPKQKRIKFEAYLQSHYCRKLLQMKQISIQTKSINTKINLKVATASIYLESNRNPKNSLQVKRELAHVGQETTIGEQIDEQESSGNNYGNDNINNPWKIQSEESNYFFDLNYVDNLKMNLQTIETLQIGGVTTLKLNDQLVAKHRKKTNLRILDGLQGEKSKRLKVQPTRNGKSYFVRYWLENKECQAKVSKQVIGNSARKLCKVEETIDNADYGIMATEKKEEQSYALVERPGNVILKDELIFRLFEKVYQLFLENEDLVTIMLDIFGVKDNFMLYRNIRNSYKDFSEAYENSLKTRLHEICEEKIKQVSDRVFGMIVNQKEIFVVFQNTNQIIKQDGLSIMGVGGNRKVNTQARLDRLIYIWNLVTDKAYISTIDLSNNVNNVLEKETSFKIDRRTMQNLIKDLQDLGLVKVSQYKIKISSEIGNSDKELIRSIVIDSFREIPQEIIQTDPSLINPTLKRDLPLPESLKFLAGDDLSGQDNQAHQFQEFFPNQENKMRTRGDKNQVFAKRPIANTSETIEDQHQINFSSKLFFITKPKGLSNINNLSTNTTNDNLQFSSMDNSQLLQKQDLSIDNNNKPDSLFTLTNTNLNANYTDTNLSGSFSVPRNFVLEYPLKAQQDMKKQTALKKLMLGVESGLLSWGMAVLKYSKENDLISSSILLKEIGPVHKITISRLVDESSMGFTLDNFNFGDMETFSPDDGDFLDGLESYENQKILRLTEKSNEPNFEVGLKNSWCIDPKQLTRPDLAYKNISIRNFGKKDKEPQEQDSKLSQAENTNYENKKNLKLKMYTRVSERLLRGVRLKPGITAREALGRISEKIDLNKIVSMNILTGNFNVMGSGAFNGCLENAPLILV